MAGSKPDERICTPMQWENSEFAGFSDGGGLWQSLQDAANLAYANVASQTGDPDSLLSHYRRLIHLRTENSALRRGDLTAVDSSYRGVYAFLRHDEQQALLVVTNLDDEPAAGSSLSLEGTDMALGEASLAFGRGALVPPRIKPQGGFEAYQPVETLAAQSLIVFEFETKPGQ